MASASTPWERVRAVLAPLFADDKVVRFLVLPPERAELARFKLARSPLLRKSIEDRAEEKLRVLAAALDERFGMTQ